MSLADDLAKDDSFVKVQSLFCGVCQLLEKLPQEESVLLQKRMSDPLITHMSLSRVLRNNGYNISDGVMGRHRRGSCTRVAQ